MNEWAWISGETTITGKTEALREKHVALLHRFAKNSGIETSKRGDSPENNYMGYGKANLYLIASIFYY
jgi:hypothetical protein